MSNYYFIADTHFRHKLMIEPGQRPFSSLDEMDQTIIDNINRKARKDDIICHLGDLCYWGGTDDEYETLVHSYLNSIRCENWIYVKGNHDKRMNDFPSIQSRFRSFSDYKEIKVKGKGIVLFHYPLRSWNKRQYLYWALHGHEHCNVPDDPNSLLLDVGVEGHNYEPWSFDEIQDRMQTKKFVPIGHHQRPPKQPKKPRPLKMKLPCLVSGDDLRTLGLAPGPEFGQIIKTIQKMQAENPSLTKEEALSWIVQTNK